MAKILRLSRLTLRSSTSLVTTRMIYNTRERKAQWEKLHNVVKFIRSSPQRSELFKKILRKNKKAQEYLLAGKSAAELGVVINNDTR